MRNILELEHEKNHMDALRDMVSIMDILEDKATLVTREGGLVQVLQLKGKDYGGLTSKEKQGLFEKRKIFFEQLPDNVKVSFHYHRIKYRIDDRTYDLGDKYAEKIAELHDTRFEYAFRTDIYVVVHMPDKRILAKSGIAKRDYDGGEYYKQRAQGLNDVVDSMMTSLEDYDPVKLKHTTNGKSKLLRFWMYILQGGVEPKITPKQNFDLNDALVIADIGVVSQKKDRLFSKLKKHFKNFNLSDDQASVIRETISDVYDRFDRDYIITYNEGQKRYTAFVAMKSYPDETDKHILDGVMSVEAEFNLVQTVKMIHDETAKALIEVKINRWNTAGRFAKNVVHDLYDANEKMQSDEFRIGKHSLTIAVHGDTKEECEHGIRMIMQSFQAVAINSLRETFGTEHAFWSQFPDYEGLNDPRGAEVSSLTMADMINLGTKTQGNLSCSFGDAPITYFKTPDGQNYAFTLHPEPGDNVAGHTMIFGSTGSGKTVFWNMLMANLLKYRTKKGVELKQIVFDSLKGIKVPIKAFGGEYIDFNDDIQLNPLQLPDTSANRTFLGQWIGQLAGGLTPKEEDDVMQAIAAAYTLWSDKDQNIDPKQRNLYLLAPMLGLENFENGANLAAKLKKWMPTVDDQNSAYEYGKFFNHTTDALNFDKRIVGFDMTNMLKDDIVLGPLTSYIFHSFIETIKEKNTPHVCFMDEAIQYMHNDQMYPFIEKFLREHRKLNGVFVGAVQSPSLMMGNKKIEELLTHIKTYVIFPDPQATEEDYIGNEQKKGLGLTQSEFKWVRSKKSERQVMIKRSTGESTILNVDLSHLGSHFTLLRSDLGIVEDFEEIYNDWHQASTGGYNVKDWQEQLMEKHP